MSCGDNKSQASSVAFYSEISDTTKSSVRKRRSKEKFVLFLYNLPESFNHQELVSLFKGKFEGFKRAFFTKQKGTGVAVFYSAKETTNCAQKMKGMSILDRKINVRIKISKGENRQLDEHSLMESPQIEVDEKVNTWLAQTVNPVCDDTSSLSSSFGLEGNDRGRSLSSSTVEHVVALNYVQTDEESAISGAVSTQMEAVFAVVVNKLPHFVTAKKLHNCFSKKCQGVKHAAMINRGCGEVVFNTQEEMETCLKKMNKSSQFGGGPIRVCEKTVKSEKNGRQN